MQTNVFLEMHMSLVRIHLDTTNNQMALREFNFTLLSLYIILVYCLSVVDLSENGELHVEINDILNAKLMPFSAFSHLKNEKLPHYRKQLINISHLDCSDFKTALTIMRFHRNMMKEYFARSFIVEGILSPIVSNSVARRIGMIKNKTSYGDNGKLIEDVFEGRQPRHENYITNHRLLQDEGSTLYQDWLKRSTTLDDIYRQIYGSNATSIVGASNNVNENRNNEAHHRRHSTEKNLALPDIVDEDHEFEDGDITGYALSNGIPELSQPRLVASNHLHMTDGVGVVAQSGNFNPKIFNKNGYEPTYDGYGGKLPNPPPHSAPVHVQTTQKKEVSLKDITDIALTTLAFLSFGMFILQVLMCITMGKDDTTNMVMLPMEATGTESDVSTENTEEIRRRRKRSVVNEQRLLSMNTLARQALYSIDAVLIYSQDNGSCHYFSICEHNRFASKQSDIQKLWIPIWSLGMSWFSSRLSRDSSKSLTEYIPILQSLKASVIGLGNGNCQLHYGDNCTTYNKY